MAYKIRRPGSESERRSWQCLLQEITHDLRSDVEPERTYRVQHIASGDAVDVGEIRRLTAPVAAPDELTEAVIIPQTDAVLSWRTRRRNGVLQGRAAQAAQLDVPLACRILSGYQDLI